MKFALSRRISSAVLALFVVIAPHSSYASWEFLQPTKLIEKIRDQIAKQNIGLDLNLFNGDIFRGFSTALNYRLQSEPSYLDGFYTRVDRYTFQAQVNPGNLLEGNDSPIGFSIQQGDDVIFARQFKSQGESLRARPYSLKNLPLNANKALSNLQVGDFVALQANLGIIFSVGGTADLSPALSLSGATHVYLSGDFMIHFFRMNDDKIRVKLITLRRKGVSADASLNYAAKFKVIGLKVVQNKIEKMVNLTPLSLNFGKGVNDVFMLDYVFDLKNPQALQAFDNFMSKKMKFKDLKVIDPTATRTDLTEDLLTDMSEVEQIFAEDRNLPLDQRRIDRVFKGSNTSLDSTSGFKLGLNILKINSDLVYSQNQLLSFDREEREQKFLLNTYNRQFESRILYGMFGGIVTTGNNLVFKADDSWNPAQFVTLTSYTESKLKSVSPSDYRKVQDQVRAVIPADRYAEIDWKNWDFSRGTLTAGYFKQQLFINPEALSAIPTLDEAGFYKAFVAYIEKTGAPPRIIKGDSTTIRGSSWADDYQADLKTISHGLADIVNPASSKIAIFNDFKTMQTVSLWRERGIGFIQSIIPQTFTGSMVSYEMTFSARGVDPIHYKFGTFVNEELYKSLMYIQNIINDRSFDLRLLTENGELKQVKQDVP